MQSNQTKLNMNHKHLTISYLDRRNVGSLSVWDAHYALIALTKTICIPHPQYDGKECSQ